MTSKCSKGVIFCTLPMISLQFSSWKDIYLRLKNCIVFIHRNRPIFFLKCILTSSYLCTVYVMMYIVQTSDLHKLGERKSEISFIIRTKMFQVSVSKGEIKGEIKGDDIGDVIKVRAFVHIR